LKSATWGQIEEFCRKDGWKQVRETTHTFFENVLADGTVLQTHRSFAKDKTMSPGRFKAILRLQLQVSEKQFWEVLRTGQPAKRPAMLPDETVKHPAYVVRVLKQNLGKTEKEIARLSLQQARRMVEEYWSRARGNG